MNGGSTTGSTIATLSYGGVVSSSIGVRTYADPTLGCPASITIGAVEGLIIANGTISPTQNTGAADVYLTGPACADKSTAATTLHAPAGFQAYTDATPIAAISTALPFTSTGATLSVGAILAAPSTYGVLVIKGAMGDYAKFRRGAVGCGGSTTLCENDAEIGTLAVYGAGGFFPF
ncbi:MAG: hypothetical protein JWM87_750 [Candidatus Eremiobacteraeota bacterium]|nr:hypothetical protein [Candidatus Eremiobacteraeota bacterium]